MGRVVSRVKAQVANPSSIAGQHGRRPEATAWVTMLEVGDMSILPGLGSENWHPYTARFLAAITYARLEVPWAHCDCNSERRQAALNALVQGGE